MCPQRPLPNARVVSRSGEHTRAHCNKGSRNGSKKGSREVTRGRKNRMDSNKQQQQSRRELFTFRRERHPCQPGCATASAGPASGQRQPSWPGGPSWPPCRQRAQRHCVAGKAKESARGRATFSGRRGILPLADSGERDSPLGGTDLGLLLTLGLDGGNVGADDTTVGLDGLARPLLGLLLADALLVDAAVDDGPGDLARVLALQEERLLLRRREAVVAVSGTREEKETKVDRAGVDVGRRCKSRTSETGMDRQTISSSVPAPLPKPRNSSSPGAPSKTHRKIFESVRTKRRPCCARPRKSSQHPIPANNVGGAPCEGERENGPGRGRSCSPRRCRTRPSWLAKVCTKDVT